MGCKRSLRPAVHSGKTNCNLPGVLSFALKKGISCTVFKSGRKLKILITGKLRKDIFYKGNLINHNYTSMFFNSKTQL